MRHQMGVGAMRNRAGKKRSAGGKRGRVDGIMIFVWGMTCHKSQKQALGSTLRISMRYRWRTQRRNFIR